ncbi:MAG: hypothetical protein ACRDKL_02650 [Solirubrobacteraceae bacterium]
MLIRIVANEGRPAGVAVVIADARAAGGDDRAVETAVLERVQELPLEDPLGAGRLPERLRGSPLGVSVVTARPDRRS